MRRPLLTLLAVGVLAGGCASARPDQTSGAVYTEEVGPAIVPAVEREAMPILQRFGYTIQRTDRTPDRISIESNWVTRAPFTDEAANGAREMRTRVLVNTRPRSTTNSAGSSISGVTLRVEVEQMGAAGSWQPSDVRSPEMASIVRRLMEAFRLELQVKGLEG